jgi:preprotein translocase subunit YajC
MYFLLIRPQKKREKEINEMRDSIEAGDQVVTIGGICGKVMKAKDDDVLVIQVGADKVKFDVKRWAVSSVEKKKVSNVQAAAADKEEETDTKPAKPKRLTRPDSKKEETNESEPSSEV